MNLGESPARSDLGRVSKLGISDAKDARRIPSPLEFAQSGPQTVRPRIQILNRRRERTVLCDEDRRNALRFGSKAAQIGVDPESFCVLLTSQRRSVHFSLLAMQTYISLMSMQLNLEL